MDVLSLSSTTQKILSLRSTKEDLIAACNTLCFPIATKQRMDAERSSLINSNLVVSKWCQRNARNVVASSTVGVTQVGCKFSGCSRGVASASDIVANRTIPDHCPRCSLPVCEEEGCSIKVKEGGFDYCAHHLIHSESAQKKIVDYLEYENRNVVLKMMGML